MAYKKVSVDYRDVSQSICLPGDWTHVAFGIALGEQWSNPDRVILATLSMYDKDISTEY